MPKNLPKCDSCDSVVINGIYCHERGCPNIDKKCNPDTQEWESVYSCPECGCEYDNEESAALCCADIDLFEDCEEN